MELKRGIIYRGYRRSDGTTVVTSGGQPLKLRLDLKSHSPNGFEWGYGGSGPAQLALAILADYTGDDGTALELYQDFKAAMIQDLPEREFELAGITIFDWFQKRLIARQREATAHTIARSAVQAQEGVDFD